MGPVARQLYSSDIGGFNPLLIAPNSCGVQLNPAPPILGPIFTSLVNEKSVVGDLHDIDFNGLEIIFSIANQALSRMEYNSFRRITSCFIRKLDTNDYIWINMKVYLSGSSDNPTVFVTLRPSSKPLKNPKDIASERHSEKDKFGGTSKVPRRALQWTFAPKGVWSIPACTLTTKPGANIQMIQREIELFIELNNLQESEGVSYIPKLLCPPFAYSRKDHTSSDGSIVNGNQKVAFNLALYNGGDLFDYVREHSNTSGFINRPYETYNQLKADKSSLVLEVIGKFLRACTFFHRNGYAIGDVKLENCLINRDANINVGITDLGSTWKVGEPFLNKTLGTPSYGAPEIIEHTMDGFMADHNTAMIPSRDLDFKVDSWSCGVTMHILLTDSYPMWEKLSTAVQSLLILYHTVKRLRADEQYRKEGRADLLSNGLNLRIAHFINDLKNNFPPEAFATVGFGINPFVPTKKISQAQYERTLSSFDVKFTVLQSCLAEYFKISSCSDVLFDSMTTLLIEFKSYFKRVWDVLDHVPPPRDPLAHLMWSLMRPDKEKRLSLTTALAKLDFMISSPDVESG